MRRFCRISTLAEPVRHTHHGPMDFEDSSLAGKLLIAMPGMGDDRFEKAVIYICAHSEEGAMGLMVNKPSPDIRLSDLLEQLEIDDKELASNMRVYIGGPVEKGRGFVLHSADYQSEIGSLTVDNDHTMTATLDVLRNIARGNGPENAMLALGYSGWGPGQLEGEIAQNGWLTCDASDDIVFGRANEFKWTAALKALGIDPILLSHDAGHA